MGVGSMKVGRPSILTEASGNQFTGPCLWGAAKNMPRYGWGGAAKSNWAAHHR